MNTFLFFGLFVLLSIIFYRAYQNTHDMTVNVIKPAKVNLQDEREISVLQISDMHLENISITPETLYKTLKHEQIDLIALTGDFLDRKRSIPKLIPYLKLFQKLNPTYGTFAVFGNHDYVLKGENFNLLKRTLISYGCKVMQNEKDYISVNGTKVAIVGIDDFSTDKSDLARSFEGLQEGYRLVLTHDPNIVLTMKDYKYDYLLSGHFHGGQIHWPKPFHLIKMGKLVSMNMVKGLHEYDGRPFYISEGLGQTGLNIRLGSRPEITIHKLGIPAKEKQKSVAI
ncbi:metallophosphoesterase [Pseudalkalibacillus caeni]|uniref:Metallophosphoesterase n=1 Tax=Exobacillus caeni TaxID=2574798 RepID=A0A5R9EV25_9BACL|nr:metallophosphoesterase [Pseudalkalibacillus caeni]TLS35072.1 metallophosphoesterase [Pseudalkalibacillus caeni]